MTIRPRQSRKLLVVYRMMAETAVECIDGQFDEGMRNAVLGSITRVLEIFAHAQGRVTLTHDKDSARVSAAFWRAHETCGQPDLRVLITTAKLLRTHSPFTCTDAEITALRSFLGRLHDELADPPVVQQLHLPK